MNDISSFLPPETVEMLALVGPQCPDQLAFDTKMTILFSDMRGFTELSERFDARTVYAAINASLGVQTRLVLQYQGSINKFLGDGLLACFSGEDRCERAVHCVLSMLHELRQREAEHADLPSPVGFGLNDGRVLLGLLGTAERREFTVIGDVVNTAARLCGVARPFYALATEAVCERLSADMLDRHASVYCSTRFKGKSNAMDVYRIDE